MNKTSATATVVICALGFAAGYAANRQVPGGEKSAPAAAVAKPAKQDLALTTAAEKTQTIHLPSIHTDETLESMIAQGGNVTYVGLALWLVDASGPDIAAYWESHRNNALNGDSNGDLRRLIFYNWTRVDPRAAISAAAGTKWASAPWSAWGAVDPQAALAAAGPEQMKSVANGIGQMQPEWLREHFDQIPEEARRNALNGLITWKEDSDHVARLDFLMAQGMGFNPAAFKTLARKDPWAAYDWLEKNDKLDLRAYGESAVDVLLATMKDAHPEDLERLAATIPSSALQRKVEDAILETLLTTDPAAALARAKSTDAPLIAAKRLAIIGNSLLASDPEKAFQIGADLLAASPLQLAPEKRVETGNGSSSWGASDNMTQSFMESLLIKDPARTLDMTTIGQEAASKPFQELAGKWASRDLVAFTEWVNRQPASPIRNAAVGQVASQLTSQGHFHEAAEWSMSGDKSNLYNLTWHWARINRAEASGWLDSANLPESEKGSLRNIINQVK
jgi:hypothetical protein